MRIVLNFDPKCSIQIIPFFKKILYWQKMKINLILGKMKKHDNTFNFLLTLKVCRIIKFSYSKREKITDYHILISWFFDTMNLNFTSSQILWRSCPEERKSKSKFPDFEGAWLQHIVTLECTKCHFFNAFFKMAK